MMEAENNEVNENEIKNTCPECKSKLVWEYLERVVIYDENGEQAGFKDWNENAYRALECQDCGWNNF